MRRNSTETRHSTPASQHSRSAESMTTRVRSTHRYSNASHYSNQRARSPLTRDSSISQLSRQGHKVQEPLLNNVLKEMQNLTKTVVHYQHQNDRRLPRIEVSINKTLVRLGDITRLSDAQSHDSRTASHTAECQRHEDFENFSSGERSRHEDARENIHGAPRFSLHNANKYRDPDFPIASLGEMNGLSHQFKDKKFFYVLVNREIKFCMPSKNMSTNRVVTAYLKRFITVRVRSRLTLKQESKNSDGDGLTLYGDFRSVYDFLITVILQAYRAGKTSLTDKEAHESLRVVWGRSKQLLKDENNKRNR